MLIRRLADPVEEVANSAQTALYSFGPAAFPQLVAAASDSDAERACRALSTLSSQGRDSLESTEVLQSVLRALDDERPALRAQAAAGLGQLLSIGELCTPGEIDHPYRQQLFEAESRLCAACSDPDPAVRLAAAAGLAHVSVVGTALLDALQSGLLDASSRAVREAAAQSLGKLAGKLLLSQVSPAAVDFDH